MRYNAGRSVGTDGYEVDHNGAPTEDGSVSRFKQILSCSLTLLVSFEAFSVFGR